jgi:hypothetical protein
VDQADADIAAGAAAPGSPALPAGLRDNLAGSDAELVSQPASPSLKADLDALIADGKTYLEAELTYQKSRAGFAADRLKWSVVYGGAALGLLHLALIALTVGLVIALASLIGPWLATAVVTATLLLGVWVLVSKLRSKLSDLRDAFGDGT